MRKRDGNGDKMLTGCEAALFSAIAPVCVCVFH